MPGSFPGNAEDFPVFHDYFSTLKEPRRTGKGRFFYPLSALPVVSAYASYALFDPGSAARDPRVG